MVLNFYYNFALFHCTLQFHDPPETVFHFNKHWLHQHFLVLNRFKVTQFRPSYMIPISSLPWSITKSPFRGTSLNLPFYFNIKVFISSNFSKNRFTWYHICIVYIILHSSNQAKEQHVFIFTQKDLKMCDRKKCLYRLHKGK